MPEIFLGRTEEQERFRQVLRRLQPGWLQRQLPTLSKPFAKPLAKLSPTLMKPFAKPLAKLPQEPDQETGNLPFILLFHGEGGMGKTTLIQRLRQIVDQETAFRDQFQVLFLDWERQRDQPLSKLNVGHDYIEPETVLQGLYQGLVKAGWGAFFEGYRQREQEIQRVEEKMEKVLRSRPHPDLPNEVASSGARGLAWLIRRAGLDVSAPDMETALKVSAETLHQTRQFVQKALTPKEFDIYAQPQERLAEALGQGLAKLSQRQPLVLFLDTFEIVDRPDCDYTLRTAIRGSGPRVLWAIAGRANLADSGRRGSAYFRGYNADFPDSCLYARALSEFSLSDIQTYFQAIVPERPITAAQSQALARFSLGIPFVLREAAAMWRDGAEMDTIVAPVDVELGQLAAHQQVINKSSERFLVHCFSAKEQEQDLQAIYALALLHRPHVALLQAMLDCEDLEGRLRSLRQRYSFIWVEQLQLAEKLTRFIRDYLLPDLRRTAPLVQQIVERAIAWLELDLETRLRPLTDTADRFEDEAIAKATIALVYYQFWHDEDAGWQALLPRFVEGWQYDRSWTINLLDTVALFKPHWSQTGRRRFELLSRGLSWSADPEDSQRLLGELDKPTPRQWLNGQGLDGQGAAERQTILRFKQGEVLYQQERYDRALSVYLEVKTRLTASTRRLQTDLAEALYTLSKEFIWPAGSRSSTYSHAGEQAIEAAIALNAEPTWGYYYRLGVVKDDAGQYEEAMAAYQQAIALDPNYALPHNGLGLAYHAQGQYEEAMAAYQQAIALDLNDAYTHHGLGNVYVNQGQYEQAIAAYHQAIALDPNDAAPHNGLGIAYADQGQYEQAIAAYHQAIALDPNYAYPHIGLGVVYYHQGQYEEAIAAYHRAIALDPNDAAPHNNLGEIWLLQNQLDRAETAFRKAIQNGGERYNRVFSLGLTKALQGQQDEAIALWQKSLTLYRGTTLQDQLTWLLIAVALEEETLTAAQLQQRIAPAQAAQGLLQETLELATLLARCPVKPAQADALIAQLQAVLEEGK